MEVSWRHKELTSGSFPWPTASDVVDEDMMIDSEYVPENENVGHGAAEVIDLVLNACSAGEAAEPFEEEPEFEEEDDSAPLEVARDTVFEFLLDSLSHLKDYLRL